MLKENNSIKIKSIEANRVYQVNNGYAYKDSNGKIHDCKLTFGEAVINDGIFLRYMKKHGVKEENIKSQITEKYKPIYLEAKKNGNYADLKNLLISAYMMCGDSHSEAMKKIDNWSKQKKS